MRYFIFDSRGSYEEEVNGLNQVREVVFELSNGNMPLRDLFKMDFKQLKATLNDNDYIIRKVVNKK